MSNSLRSPRSPYAVLLWPLRMLYKGTLFILLAFAMAPAHALRMIPKIEKPERKNRIVQLDEKR